MDIRLARRHFPDSIVIRQALVFLHPIEKIIHRVLLLYPTIPFGKKQSPRKSKDPLYQAKRQESYLKHTFKRPYDSQFATLIAFISW